MSRQKLVLLTCVIAIVLFSVISAKTSNGQSAEKLKQRFLEEAPGKWETYCSFADRLQGKITELRERNGKTISYGFGEHKHNSTCRLFRSQSLPKRAGKSEATVYNSRYAFSLGRKGEGPWVLTKVEKHREGEDSRILSETLQNSGGIRTLVEAPHNTYLGDLVRQPTFRIQNVAAVRKDGIELIRIAFDNAHPVAEKPICPIQGGEMLLDPNRFWYLCSGTFRCQFSEDNAIVKIETEMRDPHDNYPVPRRWIQSVDLRRDGGHMAIKSTMDFEVQEPSSLPPDEEFTLTAFGLHEPLGFAKKSIPWYRWAALAAFPCLALAVLFRWLARRAKAKTTS